MQTEALWATTLTNVLDKFTSSIFRVNKHSCRNQRRTQWSNSRRRGSAADRCLGLWVLVSVVCQEQVSAKGQLLVQRSPVDCVVSLCVIQKPLEWGGRDPR
jgi:hypothetical protein